MFCRKQSLLTTLLIFRLDTANIWTGDICSMRRLGGSFDLRSYVADQDVDVWHGRLLQHCGESEVFLSRHYWLEVFWTDIRQSHFFWKGQQFSTLAYSFFFNFFKQISNAGCLCINVLFSITRLYIYLLKVFLTSDDHASLSQCGAIYFLFINWNFVLKLMWYVNYAYSWTLA